MPSGSGWRACCGNLSSRGAGLAVAADVPYLGPPDIYLACLGQAWHLPSRLSEVLDTALVDMYLYGMYLVVLTDRMAACSDGKKQARVRAIFAGTATGRTWPLSAVRLLRAATAAAQSTHAMRAATKAPRKVGARGGRKQNSPRRRNFFFNRDTCPPPQPRIQKFLPAGDFFYPNARCPRWAHRPPPKRRPHRCPPPP